MQQSFEATSTEGFVAQVVNLITHGYRYYFTGRLKPGKDPAAFDTRMADYYGAGLPKWTRERRKRRGLATFRYVRFEECFVVLASVGEARQFFEEDRHRIRDIRETPLRFKGYSIGFKPGGRVRLSAPEREARNRLWEEYREAVSQGRRATRPPPTPRDMKWHAHVRIDPETYSGLKSYFLNIACHRDGKFIADEFYTLPFEPYAPVRVQIKNILRAVNLARAVAGFQRIPYSVIRYKRRIVPVFKQAWSEYQACATRPAA